MDLSPNHVTPHQSKMVEGTYSLPPVFWNQSMSEVKWKQPPWYKVTPPLARSGHLTQVG